MESQAAPIGGAPLTKAQILKTIDEIQARLKYDVDTLIDIYDTVIKMAVKLDPIYKKLRKEFGDECSLDKEYLKTLVEKKEVLKDCNMLKHINYKLNEMRNNINNTENIKDIARNLADFAADLTCKLYGKRGGHVYYHDDGPLVVCESWNDPIDDGQRQLFEADGWRALRKFKEMMDKIKMIHKKKIKSIVEEIETLKNIIIEYEREFKGLTNDGPLVADWLSREELISGLRKLSGTEIFLLVTIINSAYPEIIEDESYLKEKLIKIEKNLKEKGGYDLCKINMYRECDDKICNDILNDIIYGLAKVVGHVHCVAKGYPCSALDPRYAYIVCGCTRDDLPVDVSVNDICGKYPSLKRREEGKCIYFI